MGGKTDIRWSEEEWAALEGFAASSGMTPGRAAKAIVVAQLATAINLRAVTARKIGSAAPRERETVRAAAPVIERAALKSGLASDGDVLGSGGGLGTGSGAVPSPSAQVPDLMADLKESFDRVRRPEGSAGSGPAVPPAAGSAAPVSSPAGAETAGVTLLSAVVAALRAQNVVNGTELVARKAIRAGQVVVDGEVCTDPDRLVDPGALG